MFLIRVISGNNLNQDDFWYTWPYEAYDKKRKVQCWCQLLGTAILKTTISGQYVLQMNVFSGAKTMHVFYKH